MFKHRSVKYLYKYVYKGPDRAVVSIRDEKNEKNEIAKYLNSRYVSAIEAYQRLFNFGLQERSHKVERLPVHLHNQQNVTFRDDEGEEITIFLEKSSHTKLTRYFEIYENN